MNQHRASRGIAALLTLFLSSTAAASDSGTEGHRRPPIPEPMIGESITNIEGTESGELELDLDTLLLRSPNGGTARGVAVEGEWRATDRLGVMLEAGTGQAGSSATTEWSLRTGLSWSLFHDLDQDFHLQAEVTGRFGEQEGGSEGPIELPHPFSAGLRSAIRSGSFTARAGAGVAFGDGASLFTQLALLWNLPGTPSKAFAGVEINANAGSGPPLTIVPQVFVTVLVFQVPVAFGLGIPWSPPLRAGQETAIGAILRLVLELD